MLAGDRPSDGQHLMTLYFNHLRPGATGGFVQAGHRRTAAETALALFEESAERERSAGGLDQLDLELMATTAAWLGESLVQGAYLREYHAWEKDTKQYIEEQFRWNGRQPWRWNSSQSHVEKVRLALEALHAVVPEQALAGIDSLRIRVNAFKHSSGWSEPDFPTRADLDNAMTAVEEFWSSLADQEQYDPRELGER